MRIALYPRVSTQEQALSGHSIDEQIDRMKKYCDAMGWTIHKIYTDAGFSGANTDRPALQKMIRDIKNGKVDKVLVYKLDRLSRSQKDTLELIEDVFLANNVDFVSMSENFDTSTPFGRAMIGILAVFAQLEREQIKERMNMGKLARAKQGKYHGSDKVPIGYDYIDGELVTNEFEKMQIKHIFEWYASGMSTTAITKKLNESGLIHKYGKWSQTVVRTILPRKTYIGYLKYRDEWYKGNHEPFISEELFEKVQEIRKRKTEEHQRYNKRAGKATSYLAGCLYCAKCHAKYTKCLTGKGKKGKAYQYNHYVCNSRSKKNPHLVKDPNCKNKRWKMDELDNLVFDEIRKLALDPDYIVEITESRQEDERPSIINAEIKKLDDQLSRLMDLFGMSEMPLEILQKRVHDLNDKKLNLEHELESIQEEKERKLSHDETRKLVKSFSDILERGDLDEIRSVIGTLINRIDIDGDDVTIQWNFL